jgi:hypothetical protein
MSAGPPGSISGYAFSAGVSGGVGLFAIGSVALIGGAWSTSQANKRWTFDNGDQIALWVPNYVYYRGKWADTSCHVRSHYYEVTADVYRGSRWQKNGGHYPGACNDKIWSWSWS